jgi:hypothetical protein
VSFAFTTIEAGQQTEKGVVLYMGGICFGTRPSEINVYHYRNHLLSAPNRVHANLIVLLPPVLLACIVHKKTSQLPDQVGRLYLRTMFSCSGSPAVFARPVAFRIHTDQDLAFSEPTARYYYFHNLSTRSFLSTFRVSALWRF